VWNFESFLQNGTMGLLGFLRLLGLLLIMINSDSQLRFWDNKIWSLQIYCVTLQSDKVY
jgi:hypothetical protein